MMKSACRYVCVWIGMAALGCAQSPGGPGAVTGVGGGGGEVSNGSGGTTQTGEGGGGAGGGSVGSGAGGSGTTTQTTSAISGSRLKAYWLTTSDGAQQFDYLWRDTQLNIDCSIGMAPDGQYRCLPTALGGIGTYFSDSGCSTPLMVAAFTCSAASPQPPPYISVSQSTGTGCSTTTKTTIYNTGSPYTGGVYSGTSTSCLNLGPTYAQEGVTLYSVGSVLDVTMFAQATRGYQ